MAPQAWLTQQSLTLDPGLDATALILVNKLGTGYYRVNYDTATWLAIAKVLLEDHQAIHPLHRASIICDIVSLAHMGRVSEVSGPHVLPLLLLLQATLAAVLEYREREGDFGPLMAFRECVDSGRVD